MMSQTYKACVCLVIKIKPPKNQKIINFISLENFKNLHRWGEGKSFLENSTDTARNLIYKKISHFTNMLKEGVWL